MSTYDFYQIVFSCLLTLAGGCYSGFTGYLMYSRPDKYEPFLKWFRPPSLRKMSLEESISENRRHGLMRLVGGGILLVAGGLQMIALLLMK